MPTVTDSHIQLTIECPECGHQWDIEDRDAQSIQAAIDNAENADCPECGILNQATS